MRLIFVTTTSALPGDDVVKGPTAGSVAEGTRLSLSRLANELHRRGAGLGDLVKVNCYLSRDEHRTEFWNAWAEVFAPLDASPLRLTHVAGIGDDCRVMLDATALVSESSLEREQERTTAG